MLENIKICSWNFNFSKEQIFSLSKELEKLPSLEEAHREELIDRIMFSKDNFFLKMLLSPSLDGRKQPFRDLRFHRMLINYERSAAIGDTIGIFPRFFGSLSFKKDNEWLWNGIIIEYLEGWRTLDRKDPGDIKLAEEAADQMAKLRIYNRDFHQKNIMTDGNGAWKVVDLEDMLFDIENPEEARRKMMQKFLTLEI